MKIIALMLILTAYVLADAREVSVFELPVDKAITKSALITKMAKRYKLDRTVLSCLYKVESNYDHTAVSTTHDYGIGQINGATAKGFKINVKRLTTDLVYSMDRSAYILSYYQWLKRKDEPATWIMRFNVGPGPLHLRNRAVNGLKYMEKINKCRTSEVKGEYL